MLPVSLKRSGPPTRLPFKARPTEPQADDNLQKARANPSDGKLQAVLGAMASLALTLAPQAAEAATETFFPISEDLVSGQNQMMLMQAQQMQQMQQMANQLSVGQPFGKQMEGAIPAGSLLISDGFAPMEVGLPAHGQVVDRAAEEMGFRGQVFTDEQPASMASRTAQNSLHELGTPNLNKDDVRRYLASYAEGTARGLVETQITAAHRAIESGARHSTLNISSGTSKARLTNDLYQMAALSWTAEDPEVAETGDIFLENYATAFELNTDKLKSNDPGISGLERKKLQQGLIDHVSSTLDNSRELAQAKQEWKGVVSEFEGRHNSVVVSVGNQGDLLREFKKDNLGLDLQVPEGFEDNVLANDEVTTVGATRWFRTDNGLREYQANYNSNSDQTDIYASGSVAWNTPEQADIWGSSFSAPRVSVTMAQLHKDNPDLSSDQVEALMKKSLTHELETESGSITVLDYHLASDYLVGR